MRRVPSCSAKRRPLTETELRDREIVCETCSETVRVTPNYRTREATVAAHGPLVEVEGGFVWGADLAQAMGVAS